jgi:hypothetical protein
VAARMAYGTTEVPTKLDVGTAVTAVFWDVRARSLVLSYIFVTPYGVTCQNTALFTCVQRRYLPFHHFLPLTFCSSAYGQDYLSNSRGIKVRFSTFVVPPIFYTVSLNRISDTL